jgi:hypothetical protein
MAGGIDDEDPVLEGLEDALARDGHEVEEVEADEAEGALLRKRSKTRSPATT